MPNGVKINIFKMVRRSKKIVFTTANMQYEYVEYDYTLTKKSDEPVKIHCERFGSMM